MIPSIVAAQTVMRLEEERRKKLKAKPAGITFGRGNPMPLSNEEITEIATRTADEVMGQIRFGGSEEGLAAAKDAVLGVGAYIMPERHGTKGACTCCIIDPSKPIVPKNLMCTTTGAIGTLKDSEEEELCDELIFVKDGRCARARGLREASEECKEKHPHDTKKFFECYIPKFSEITGGSNPGEYVTITDPGKTTFKPGEIVSREAFERENERVKRLGEKPATGR